MKNSYDLTDIGYLYRGPASQKMKSCEHRSWKVIDIPQDVHENRARFEVDRFLDNICAIELPTSFICNLRCRYCYIDDPRMKSKKNDPQVFVDIIKRANQLFPAFLSDSKKEIFITPWGAEPLCDLDVLEAVYEVSEKLFGSRFKTSTSTNATIWNERIERMFERLIRSKHLKDLQISLDGPKWVQDKFRPYLGGKGSFDNVRDFTLSFVDLCKKCELPRPIHHYCSTIHLDDEDFVNAWVSAAEFFTEPQTWHFQPSLPMRVSALNFDKSKNVDGFIEAQKRTHEVLKRRVQQNIFCMDFYTSKLFLEKSCKTRNAFIYCSALNTQIGIDIDGSIYLCHGPITSPWFKPFMWFGNIFDGTISYQKLIRNLSWMYNVYSRAKCTTCPLYHYCLGNVCWSCPPHNLAATGEPSTDYIEKCPVYCECFKYWFANAYMICKGEVIERVPKDAWFTEGIDYDSLPQLPDEQKVDPITAPKTHFDWNYDGTVMHALRRVLGFDDYKMHVNFHVESMWWKFFDYFEKAIQEEKEEDK